MPALYLVIPEHTDAEGVTRSIVMYGADDAPEHFRAALHPAQADPLLVMRRLLAPGWEAHAGPHPGMEFNEVSEITFLGLDIEREGVRLSVLRGFPLGAEAGGRDLAAVVRDAIGAVEEMIADREQGGGAGFEARA
ncbi:MAG TPA: hypothetical protein VFS40_06600 [Gemmatimonadales bacterium]|nr:hypothetical protein [Gemmatimonadales bacterium]